MHVSEHLSIAAQFMLSKKNLLKCVVTTQNSKWITTTNLLNIFSNNLDLRENITCVSARTLRVREYMSFLTARELKA